jgi:hypothetical protein
MGCCETGTIALSFCDMAVDLAVGEFRGKKVQRHFELECIDILALARSSSVVKRSSQQRGDKPWDDNVGLSTSGAIWWQIGPAGHVIKSSHASGVITVSGD